MSTTAAGTEGQLANRRRRFAAHWVAVLALALTACGGADPQRRDETPQVVDPSSPTLVAARERHCGEAALHDNGTVLYLTVAPDCDPPIPLTIRVDVADANGLTQREWTLPGFDLDVDIEVSPGRFRRVSMHRRGSWRAIERPESWGWRDGAGLLAKDGGLYLIGGWSSDTGLSSEVWFSRDLAHWSLLSPGAPWAGRHGAGWVVHRDRLWVIGGDLHDDVWSSSDGVDWTRESGGAEFGGRYSVMAASLDDRLLVFGGQTWGPSPDCAFAPECYAIGFNDSWASGDGRRWQQVQSAAPWAGRGLIHGSMVFRQRLYLVGGGLKLAMPGHQLSETVAEHHDVWSTADGVAWRKEAEDAGFSARTHITVLATASGCYVAGGSVGTQLNTTAEVYFAPDCIRYRLLPGRPDIGVRHAASLVEYNGAIVMLGGHRDTAGTTIWQYFPAN